MNVYKNTSLGTVIIMRISLVYFLMFGLGSRLLIMDGCVGRKANGSLLVTVSHD